MNFLSVQKKVPNFIASEAKVPQTIVWIRLPQLPTEFYDGLIRKIIGNKIGRFLKIDACNSSTLRGREEDMQGCILKYHWRFQSSYLSSLASTSRLSFMREKISYIRNVED